MPQPGPSFRERVSFELDQTAESVAEARRRIVRAVRGRMRREEIDRVQLLVSELASNAVRHGSGGLEVVLLVYEGRVRVEVQDRGLGFVPAPRALEPEQTGGWGLFLVERLSERWGVVGGDGTRVWFEVVAGQADGTR